MRKPKKSIIYLLVAFIIILNTNFATFNPKEYKDMNVFANNNDFNDNPSILKTNQGSPFIVGVSFSPVTIDPVDAWDSASNNVIEQVCEGLFRYNLSDLNMPRINWLAEEYWWENKTTLQIKLREGVFFHDYTPFDATAAKWNLDRLLYLTNCSGTLPPITNVAITSSLWRFPNGTAIIKQVDVVSLYNITIHLNGVYGPLLDLLTYTNAYMLSPSSTPIDDYIDLYTGDLVGTGPFIYNGYNPDIEIYYGAFENYWQGKANISEMVFSIISDSTARNDAMLTYDIDFLEGYLNSYFPIFEADPEISVTHFTDTYGIPGLAYWYLGFNNERINNTWRKAMSYAINYTYIIDELQSGEVFRANSPISPGFGNAYNSTNKAATWNLAKARQILKDAGIADPTWDADNDTDDPNWLDADLATFNYTYNFDNIFRSDLGILLQDNLDQIGITVVGASMTWSEYFERLFFYPDKLELFWIAWGPDYLDPFNMLDPLFNPISIGNSAQVNDLILMNMLDDALEETDDIARNNIYKNIQWYLANRLYPHAFGYHTKIKYVYSANLTKYPHNALNKLYFYPCEWDTGGITPPPPPSPVFKVGVQSSPVTIDPVDTWDSTSMNIIEQVCEGLFRYNLSDPNLPRINWLAEDYRWIDKVTLLIKLREGVLFHDGTPFDASAAKWNLDRLLYLTNCSGNLPPTTPIALPSSLWRFPNGTAIINHVEVINQTNIVIHLNGTYGALLDLLTFTTAYMLSPTSTPADDYIDLYTGDLVGTGPFVYDGYIPDIETNFHAFDNYWQGKANINEMVFSIISDSTARNDAMLAYDIDFLQGHLNSYLPLFEADPEINVTHFTDTYGIPGLAYHYLGFNNERVNITWRKAMSYAINYTYIIEEMLSGEVIRANSPISPGFGDAYNSSTKAATWNLAKARQILIDAGISGTAGLIANNETTGPVADAWKAADLTSFNYTYNVESAFRSNLYTLLIEWFDQIGITVVDDGVDWSEFLDKLFINPDKLELFWIGWGPDYLDPFNMLDPLFNPISMGNSAQVNDPQLNDMLESALKETNDAIRNNIYKNIQGYLANQLYPHAFGYHPKITYVYSANLTNYPHNALEILYFYPCEWEAGEAPPPPPPTAKIFIDDSDPNYNWSKTALENDWCSGSGTWNDPYVIKDIEIDGESIYNGIEIHNSSVYFKIENCTIHNGFYYGIWLVNTNNSIIYNNTIYNMGFSGVFLENSDNHTIYENRVWDSMGSAGITLSMFSDHCEVRNNSIDSSMAGIITIYGFDNLIFDNTMINNYMGIGVGAAYNVTLELNNVINTTMAGIILQEANETLIKNNLVTNTQDYGILLVGFWIGCHDNEIIGNQIYDNEKIGLALDSYSISNTIFLNTFIGNTLNAQDNGTLNSWDNGTIGNSWDDYGGVDANDDGIGDTPYLIDGEAGSMDNYPIFDDGPDDITPPIITINDPDIGDVFGTSPPDYDIDIIEPNLDTIWYTIDDGVNNITISSYTGTIDETLWNALSDGPVTITFYANDTLGHIGYAEVNIIKDSQAPSIIINYPSAGNTFGESAPSFDIFVSDPNLDTIWYSLDGGITNYIIIANGTINQAAWSALAEGSITITFFANDTLGHIASEDVTVIKNIPDGGLEPTTIIIIVVSSSVGAAAVAIILYIILKKRKGIP